MRLVGLTNKVNSNIHHLVDESWAERSQLSSMDLKTLLTDKKKSLGQVFTPPILAKFMISLFKNKIQAKHKILDPCIGPNTFLSLFDEMNCKPKLTGMEVDPFLITNDVKAFYKKSNRNLLLQSFLEHPSSEKYDFIIQNPPYVRQELLAKGVNSKELALGNIPNKIASLIPSQSNLYVYFLIKAILHLKENGVMVAVIYDSWLYNSFGKSLKTIFNQLGVIESIYHFKESAFSDAEIGATVIYFKRTTKANNQKGFVKYYSLTSLKDIQNQSKIRNLEPERIPNCDFADFNFNEKSVIDFNNRFFSRIKTLSTQVIQRGTSSVANGYFLHNSKLLKESIPLIKDVSRIETYSAKVETSYLLYVNEKMSKETQTYLETVKCAVIDAGDKYKAVKDKILKGEKWYKVNLKKPGNFIFNYYLRNNIDFIFNEKQLNVSDNFYILNIEENPLAYLAILNSSFTRIAVLAHSRNQGNGLRKVQLYEFNNVPVININTLSSKTIKKLEKIGKEMQTVDRYNCTKIDFIKRIDAILLAEYNVSTGAEITLEDLEVEQSKYYN